MSSQTYLQKKFPFTQTTLAQPVSCRGIGLHGGQEITMRLCPAPCDSGIVFKRTDVKENNLIPAHYSNVHTTVLCTQLANQAGVCVATIEHLMSAFSGCHVDNAVVELSESEVCIIDGSSMPFVKMIEKAGLVSLEAPRQVVQIVKPVTVEEEGKSARLTPAMGFQFDVTISFDNPLIGTQSVTLDLMDCDKYATEISFARTFGFLKDIQPMWNSGRAIGGSLDNAVVIDGEKVLNAEGLRAHDEFIRHKALDAVGDLYTAGLRILGKFTSHSGGHRINNLLLRKLFDTPQAFKILPLQDALNGACLAAAE